MTDKQKYVPICLPENLVEELKVWKIAFTMACGKNVTYAEMMRTMIDSLEKTNPDIGRTMDSMKQMNPSFSGKLSKKA